MRIKRNLIRCGRSLGEYTSKGVIRYLVTNGGVRTVLTEYEYAVWDGIRVSNTDYLITYKISPSYKESISRLMSLNLLIEIVDGGTGKERYLYITRNGNIANDGLENIITPTKVTDVSYGVTEEQYRVWREATGKVKITEIHEKLGDVHGVHKQTMLELMETIKLLVDYRLCELEYWKSKGENRAMKKEVIVGVGEGLGKVTKKDEKHLYGVNYAGERYELEESVYRVWELAKKSQYRRDELTEKMGIGSEDVNMYISCLSEVNMVLNWGCHITDEVLETHTIISKGIIIGKKEENYLFKELQEGETFTLPIVPATVWKLSDPFTNKTIKRVIEELAELTGYTEEEARYEVIGWTPYLVGCGLLLIDGLKDGGNENKNKDNVNGVN